MLSCRILYGPALVTLLLADTINGPSHMYRGGNMQIRESDPIAASIVFGRVLDPVGESIPRATIQVQLRGSESILVDMKADKKGYFRLPKLPPGLYWQGISAPGFQLQVWDLQINALGSAKRLDPQLALGV